MLQWRTLKISEIEKHKILDFWHEVASETQLIRDESYATAEKNHFHGEKFQ